MVEAGRPTKKDVICCYQHIDTIRGGMFQFKRGLSPEFVSRLNDEYESDGWWRAIADDPQLFIGIRDEYLNVYWKGNSLLRLWIQGDALAGEVHYKYLLKPKIKGNQYLQIEGGRLRLDDPANFFPTDFSDVDTLKRAADIYAGEEKSGVHKIVMSNPNIIDVEVAFGAESDQSGTRVAQRIDFSALRMVKSGPELTFYEAKAFANPELRANGKPAPVLSQLERYQHFLRDRQADLLCSYRKVCGNLASLHGVRNRFSAISEVLQGISEGIGNFRISEDVRLVVFGYDRDQEHGAVWAGHRQKLQTELGESLLLKGEAKGFTRGISSPAG